MGGSPEPRNLIFDMSSISKAGIFIDVKQLLEFTHRMVKEMDNADRRNYGDALDAVQRPCFAKDYDNYKITIL